MELVAGYGHARSAGRVAEVCGAATCGSALSFAVVAVDPWRAKLAVLLLVFPLATVLCGLCLCVLVVAARRVERQRLLAMSALAAYALLVVIWLSHSVFRSGFGAHALCGYAVAVVLSGAVAAACTGMPGPAAHRRALVAASLLLGVGVAYAGREGILTEFQRFAGLATIASLACLSLAWTTLLAFQPARGSRVMFALGVSIVGVGGLCTSWEALARQQVAARELLVVARRLTDRDGDGFSRHFGGNDCDDRDPLRFPLSPDGGCEPGPRAVSPVVTAVAENSSLERTAEFDGDIVLLTLDAFRCGFGQEGRPELRDVCPWMTAKSGHSAFEPHARSFSPTTTRSMTSLLDGSLALAPRDLSASSFAVAVRRRRYASSAIVSYPNAMGYFEDIGFDELDRRPIQRRAEDGAAAREVMESTLRTLTRDLHGARGRLVWAHIGDTHAPYVINAGEPWKRRSIEAYATTVRRTDAAVGWLTDQLAKRTRRTLVVVTADHGEEFELHGQRYHGYSLFEDAVRVPILTFVTGGGDVPPDLPAPPKRTCDILDYVVGVLDGAPPRAWTADTLLYTAPANGDEQFGMVHGRWKLVMHRAMGWSSLYDLLRDPGELTDLSTLEPATARTMTRELEATLASAR